MRKLSAIAIGYLLTVRAAESWYPWDWDGYMWIACLGMSFMTWVIIELTLDDPDKRGKG